VRASPVAGSLRWLNAGSGKRDRGVKRGKWWEPRSPAVTRSDWSTRWRSWTWRLDAQV